MFCYNCGQHLYPHAAACARCGATAPNFGYRRRDNRKQGKDSTVLGLGIMSCVLSSVPFLGIALVSLLFGGPGIQYLWLLVILFTIWLIPIGFAMGIVGLIFGFKQPLKDRSIRTSIGLIFCVISILCLIFLGVWFVIALGLGNP